ASPRGLATGTVPYRDTSFDAELDLVDHRLVVRMADGRTAHTSLDARPLADFYRDTMRLLSSFGVEAKILARPYKCGSTIPFAEDRAHVTYDRDAVHRAWTA